jgi:hypothetical protein
MPRYMSPFKYTPEGRKGFMKVRSSASKGHHCRGDSKATTAAGDSNQSLHAFLLCYGSKSCRHRQRAVKVALRIVDVTEALRLLDSDVLHLLLAIPATVAAQNGTDDARAASGAEVNNNRRGVFTPRPHHLSPQRNAPIPAGACQGLGPWCVILRSGLPECRLVRSRHV